MLKDNLREKIQKKDDSNIDLHRLMTICRTKAQIVHVVCVGAGDAFINRYWPVFRRCIGQERIFLTLADIMPLDQLIEERIRLAKDSDEPEAEKKIKDHYHNLKKHIENQNLRGQINNKEKKDRKIRIKYININEKTAVEPDVKQEFITDLEWYYHIPSHIVFILVPDDIHIEMAKPWLKRASLIIIEKPYNRKLQQAEDFERTLTKVKEKSGEGQCVPKTWVIPFDHYLSKIDWYVSHRGDYKEKMGVINSIEFSILEAGAVEKWRAPSLNAGMIYDLFSHLLAMISEEVDLSSFELDKIDEILVARHKDSPIPEDRETFAYLKFPLTGDGGNQITIEGYIGKGVGVEDEKFLKLNGQKGQITCKLLRNDRGITLKEYGKEGEDELSETAIGHEEFLEKLLRGEYVDDPMGGLTTSTAIQILRIINAIRERVEGSKQLPEYEVHKTKDDIMKQLRKATK